MISHKTSKSLSIKDKIINVVLKILLLAVAIAFIVRFDKESLLRLYVQSGIDDCQKLPVLCAIPRDTISNPNIDKEYIAELAFFNLSGIEIRAPKQFKVIKENITKVYYKKKKRKQSGAVMYLLQEEPNFFVNLFPQLKTKGINNDYEFIYRLMHSTPKSTSNLTDTFFIIMKSIFTPDLGDQKNVAISKFALGDKRGFVTYNLGSQENYFDCNVFNSNNDFLKIYIKDRNATLGIDEVLAIVSTVKTNKP